MKFLGYVKEFGLFFGEKSNCSKVGGESWVNEMSRGSKENSRV